MACLAFGLTLRQRDSRGSWFKAASVCHSRFATTDAAWRQVYDRQTDCSEFPCGSQRAVDIRAKLAVARPCYGASGAPYAQETNRSRARGPPAAPSFCEQAGPCPEAGDAASVDAGRPLCRHQAARSGRFPPHRSRNMGLRGPRRLQRHEPLLGHRSASYCERAARAGNCPAHASCSKPCRRSRAKPLSAIGLEERTMPKLRGV